MADLDLLRVFLAVYKTGSASAAGAALGILPTAVSIRIQDLERQLRAPLFERGRRGLWPTPDAHELARAVAPHLDALDRTLHDLTGSHTPIEGEIRLAGPIELLTARVVPALTPLVLRGLRLDIRTGASVNLLGDLAAGRHDLVLSLVRPTSHGVAHTELCTERMLLVGAPEWAARLGVGQPREQLARILASLPLIAAGPGLPLLKPWWRAVFDEALEKPAAVIAPGLTACLDVASAGAGITVAPHYAAESAIQRGDLVDLLPSFEAPTNPVSLVWQDRPDLPPALVAALDRLAEVSPDW